MKTITITLESRELTHDIRNTTHLVGRSALAGGQIGAEAAAQLQVDDRPSHDYQTKRAIESALASLQTLVGEWTQVETQRNDRIGEALDAGEAISIALRMPSNYNEASNRALAQAMHSYVVNQAVAQWMALHDARLMTPYMQQAASALDTVRTNLFARKRPVRPSAMFPESTPPI